MKKEGISVLLVEQNARMSLEIADHALFWMMVALSIQAPRVNWPPMRHAYKPWPGRARRNGSSDEIRVLDRPEQDVGRNTATFGLVVVLNAAQAIRKPSSPAPMR
jgi:hypothetical protein